MSRQEAGTPQKLFDTLRAEYRFDVDVCATPANAKLLAYFSVEDNALALDWSGTRCWCNPPYEDIGTWLKHHREPELVCYLLPVRADQEWWRIYKPLAEVHWFRRRIQFVPPEGVTYSTNPFASCLFIFGQGAVPGRERWRDAKTGECL